ncbi:MAG: DedA family protein [Gammaproteobacteria bacterium]|nr:DedA family protein [Gammaproteobacteria bacterium]
MRIFSPLYDRALRWAAHRHAVPYLGGLSFAEASFFPVPPDVMLAPMVLARRDRAWFFATVATLGSAFGGILGYVIGMFFFDAVEPLLHQWGYWDTYLQVRDWFSEWGIWMVFLAGFTPIPYKVFTIAAGTAAMSFVPFVFASIIGRGARFFLVTALIHRGGDKMQAALRRHIDTLGWICVVLAVAAYFYLR